MVAVTGASSQIGKYLVPHLLNSGKKVRILVNESEQPFHDIDHQGLKCILGNILDITVLENLMEGVSTVYHAEGLDSLNINNKQQLYRENVEGTANVVNAALAAGVSKLVYFSSVYSLGDKAENGEFDEKTRWSNMKLASGYGWSKHLAEREVWRGVNEGLPAIILQTGIVLSGPGEQSISGEVMDNCMAMTKTYPSGLANIVDVIDVVNIAANLAESETKNEQYILVGHKVSYKDLLNSMSQLSGKRKQFKEVSYVHLKNRALLRRPLSFIGRQQRPIMTQTLAHILSDVRSFSNQKISDHLAYVFIDWDVTAERFGSLYNEQRRKKYVLSQPEEQ
ncbi:MAG: NAD-dependent epimerase/dehydratase family protein [Bacteroidetes bacterium]|nr:NAD-dependent epimerase/dehydratase family protein [Bacteroidota bacterium]